MRVYKLVNVTDGASSIRRVSQRFYSLGDLFGRLGTACFSRSSAFYRLSVNVSRSCPRTVSRKDALMQVKDGVFKRESCGVWGCLL